MNLGTVGPIGAAIVQVLIVLLGLMPLVVLLWIAFHVVAMRRALDRIAAAVETKRFER